MDPLLSFVWDVDQEGYTLERERTPATMFGSPTSLWGPLELDVVKPKGGPKRQYRPLEHGGLWRRFAETCRTPDGVLAFANEFGLLNGVSLYSVSTGGAAGQDVKDFFATAHRLTEVAAHLDAGDRFKAAYALNQPDGPASPSLATMSVAVLPSEKDPSVFEYKLMPHSLRDVLLHQAAEAIAENRRFRRCRNEGCLNWFWLGAPSRKPGGRSISARREFCSDRCRVAHAHRQKREAMAHAS